MGAFRRIHLLKVFDLPPSSNLLFRLQVTIPAAGPKLRVSSCRFEVAGYRSKVASCRLQIARLQFQVASCRVHATGCKWQVTGPKLQVTCLRLQVAGCRSQVASCKLQVAWLQPKGVTAYCKPGCRSQIKSCSAEVVTDRALRNKELSGAHQSPPKLLCGAMC